MGMAIDYRVVVEDIYVGSLKGRKHIKTFVQPGKRRIAIHEYFAGEGAEDMALNMQLEAGKSYYFRFSQHVDQLYVGPFFDRISGHGELRVVPKEAWDSKK
tara:strand:+ start:11509 stop:11811 length:303 start_codon:yes stop_codon:yes gene_type:complete